jgi:type I restriction enzyme S subunit
MLDRVKNKGYPRPYLANLNVRWGRFDLHDLREMRFEEHEIEKYGLRHGDIVMCEGGEPGRCALWKDQLPGMTIQKALHRIRPDACMSNEFMYYNLFYRGRAGRFAPLFTGATIKHLPRQQLAMVEVDVPPMAVQERIADVLSAYDDLIENNRRRITLLEAAARLLYREWFVHFRFAGHEHVKVTDDLPEGWEWRTLGDIAKTNKESYRVKELPDEINYIDISSVAQGRVVSKTRIPASEAPGRARRKIRDGDTIWSNVRPNLRAYALMLEPEDLDVVSTGFTVLTATRVPSTWLYMFVTTENFVGHLVNHATGVGYPAVRPDDFERAELLLPPRVLLDQFHEAAEPNFRLIRKLELQNQKLAQARDLLLPRLVNGEVAG